MIFGLARWKFFKILLSLPSRGRPLCTGGEKLPLIYQDIFLLFPSGEVENFLILRYVAGGMPLGRKRGRHYEKYHPSFGTFCPKGIIFAYPRLADNRPEYLYQKACPNPNWGLADGQNLPAERPRYGKSH